MIEAGSVYRLAETVEQWEEPAIATSCYCFYPTVIGGEEFGTADEAQRLLETRLPWLASSD